MGHIYPELIIKKSYIRHNAAKLVERAKFGGMELCAVAKGFCGIPECAGALMEAGCSSVGVSRVRQLKAIKEYDASIRTLLTRIPMLSEAEEIISYCDISLNSESEVLRALSKEAVRQGKLHKVILMKDIGDLREGYISDADLIETALEVEYSMPGLELYGIGANYNCYGSVSASYENTSCLLTLAKQIETKLGRALSVISVGGSAILNLIDRDELPKGINHLRSGISIITRADYVLDKDIDDRKLPFILRAEIVELKTKPTLPQGKSGFAALNETRKYVDLGIRRRAIVAIGSQDIGVGGGTISPLDKDIKIWGSSSDHTILDMEDCKKDYKIGDCIEFAINYVACMNLTKYWDINIGIEE